MNFKGYIIIILILLFYFSFCRTVVTADSFPPLPEALTAMESDDDVIVTEVTVGEWPAGSNFYYTFEPMMQGTTIGFIIYPGAFVDPRSYAPFAHEIARDGFLTVIVKMIDDFALSSAERASKVINDYPEITKWAIGGHSLGAVGACAYTKDFTENIDGVILWAGYPSDSFRLNSKIIKAISIYGTNDGLVTSEEIEDSREDLPPYTQWIEVTGGNHTQFGWYDTSPDPIQPNDNIATITRQEQQDIVVQATVDFLNYFNLCPTDPDNDYDNDSICGNDDNCPRHPNGPLWGTCTKVVGNNHIVSNARHCISDGDCTPGEYCEKSQADNYPPGGNGVGDACDCEGDFNCDRSVDGGDVGPFLAHLNKRLAISNPCTNEDPCKGDFNCDTSVDGGDIGKFIEDWNKRLAISNPCPPCDPEVPWCVYP